MRILGSDSFTGSPTSINAIPVSYLQNQDMCILKHWTTNSGGTKNIYNYRYEIGSYLTESIPDVIIPLDNSSGSDDGGRWILCDSFMNTLWANEVKTDIINPKNTSTVVINDTLTIASSGNGCMSKGPITIISDGTIPNTEPPIYTNSTTLVKNLNAQYLNGVPCKRFLLHENYNTFIPENVDIFTIGLPNPPRNTDYSVYLTISNQQDPDPSIYACTITRKLIDKFTVKFSGIIDSPNYVLDYLIVGSFNDCGITPIPETNYLLDIVSNYINNVDSERFVVENI